VCDGGAGGGGQQAQAAPAPVHAWRARRTCCCSTSGLFWGLARKALKLASSWGRFSGENRPPLPPPPASGGMHSHGSAAATPCIRRQAGAAGGRPGVLAARRGTCVHGESIGRYSAPQRSCSPSSARPGVPDPRGLHVPAAARPRAARARCAASIGAPSRNSRGRLASLLHAASHRSVLANNGYQRGQGSAHPGAVGRGVFGPRSVRSASRPGEDPPTPIPPAPQASTGPRGHSIMPSAATGGLPAAGARCPPPRPPAAAAAVHVQLVAAGCVTHRRAPAAPPTPGAARPARKPCSQAPHTFLPSL